MNTRVALRRASPLTTKTSGDLPRRAVVPATEASYRGRSILAPDAPVSVERRPAPAADCNEYSRCQIVEPLRAAGQLVRQAITELAPLVTGQVNSGRIVDLLNVHFHDPGNISEQASTVLDNFQTLQTQLTEPIIYNCSPPADACTSSEGRVGALNELCSLGSAISLCPAYFDLPCPEQARLLIHELMHSVIGSCRDYAYFHQAGYMALPAEQATRNPDSYAQFAKMVYMGVPGCRDCSAEVQLRPGQY